MKQLLWVLALGVFIAVATGVIVFGKRWKEASELKATILPRFEPTTVERQEFASRVGGSEYGFDPKALAAKDLLTAALYRRFTDLDTTEFGMGRLTRVGTRIHNGPTAKIFSVRGYGTSRVLDENEAEVQFNGAWHKPRKIENLMVPENSVEQLILDKFEESETDVAIYTVGQFERENELMIDPKLTSDLKLGPTSEMYRQIKRGRLRPRGPAYIDINAPNAPEVFQVLDFSREAWKGKEDSRTGDAKDGWKLFASKVAAPEMSCAKCHRATVSTFRGLAQVTKGPVQKPGDAVGLLIIALRKKK